MSAVAPSRHYLVLGGTGFVGSAVVRELRARGHQVELLAAPRVASSATTAQELLSEASSEPALAPLAAAFTGVEVVINAAGLASPGAAASAALTGANALLPAVVALAAGTAGVLRVIHLSSASVQGHRSVIDESSERAPFSAYSRSKALGEEALELLALADPVAGPDACGSRVVTVRATSVQGPGRATTQSLVNIARSPLASVASPGTAATPVSSLGALAWFVAEVAQYRGDVPAIVLQPWEGLNVREVLTAAGGRRPVTLPQWLCRAALTAGFALSRSLLRERLHGSLRRVELMWFGQAQQPGWAQSTKLLPTPSVAQVLEQTRQGLPGAAG